MAHGMLAYEPSVAVDANGGEGIMVALLSCVGHSSVVLSHVLGGAAPALY